MSNILRHPIETFRSAPLAVTGGIVGAAGISSEIIRLKDSPEFSEATLGALFLGIFALSAVKTVEQLRLKKELENSIEDNGFDRQTFVRTVGSWCARQTARVVCKDADKLEEYEELCKKAEAFDAVAMKWLPHIP